MQAQEAENAPDLAKDGGKAAYGGVREGRGRCCQALQGTRGAEAEAAAHHQPEVEGGGVNQQAFSDLLLSAHLDAAQPSAHKEVGEEPFQPLPPPAQQPLPRLPRIRRRLPYTAFCASRLPFHFRRPRFGSLT